MKFVSAKKLSDVVTDPKLWRFLGFGSSVVGFICYGLSSSFHDLFGQWNLWKMLVFCIMGFMISVLMLFVNKFPRFQSRGFLFKAEVGFSILMLTSLYSCHEDRSRSVVDKNGQNYYQEILSLVSCGAFLLMSMSLSRQIQPGFEVGVSNFFLGYLIVEVMKRNIWIAMGLGFAVIVIRCFTDSLLERHLGDEGGQCDNLNHTSHVAINLASLLHEEMQSSVNNSKVEEEDATNIQSNGTVETFVVVEAYSEQDIDDEGTRTSTIGINPYFSRLLDQYPIAVADEFLNRVYRKKRKRKTRKRKRQSYV